MPANIRTIGLNESWYYVSNIGVGNSPIFNDDQDFQTFITYLSEYLNPPMDPKKIRRVFTIQGKTYVGVPHLPKNYFNKVNLPSYGLNKNGFGLILKETQKGSVKAFIKSLSTRYSIYFNKKYNKNGPVFSGPCKSQLLDDGKKVFLLDYRFHKNSKYHQHSEYLEKRILNWLGKELKNENYQDFVENYELDENEERVLQKINPSEKLTKKVPLQKHTKYIDIDQRVPELFGISIVFLLLLILGLKNISDNQNTNNSSVAGIKTDNKESLIIGIAKYGEKFEYIYENEGLIYSK